MERFLPLSFNLAPYRLFSFCLATLSMVFFSLESSASPVAYSELQSQREAYKALKKRIQRTSSRQLNSLTDDIEDMQDYPLFPYLYYEFVKRNLSYSNRAQIEDFLNDVKQAPIRNKLLKTWLKYLSDNNYKTLFLDTYEAGLGTDLLCRQLHIRRVKEQLDESWYQQVEVIWLSGYSLPDACDPVLAFWRQSGRLKPDLAIERMSLAGEAGQRSLSLYLRRYAPDDSHYIAELWSQVRRNPRLTLSEQRFPFRYAEYDSAIVQWGMKKMSWRDPQAVITSLPRWQKSNKLSETALQEIKETLAISLTLENSAQAKEWLMRAASKSASHSLWRWYLLHAVQERQWSQVIDIVKTAPMAQKTSSEFEYWYARALLETNEVDAAKVQFSQLAKQRHYYGFMSAAYLGQPPNLNVQPLQVDPKQIRFIDTHPQALRARELFFADELVNARREWFALMKTLSPDQQQAAVLKAHDWQWYDQAIVGALRVGAKNDLTIRFPTAHLDDFETAGEYYGIEPSLALAIARRESSFMEDAVSSANARGLMQLLPDTAKYLINLNGVLRPSFQKRMSRGSIYSELAKAQSNIELGVGFLHYLYQRLDVQNTAVIAAAYNAGWRKVEQWLPKHTSVPLDIWIDTIPFQETREYVKAILAYQLIYDWQRQRPLERFNTLHKMQVSPPTL